ncbi:DUF2489 domain-containing protein [uncultured Halovibrio sp.]|uniref:DUF2489 domain-containing protein n=1 Tax=uncultured Halovibrio sp. TaxID=985049 RepID=UPI0025DFC704|nr:DUF2489 domain-containing protein [uncultured Halovibrio sp.]
MPQNMQWMLIIAGLIAIAGLSLYILRKGRRLRQHQRALERTQALQAERRESMIESIRILAMTLEQEQVEPSEGCIRIKGLLDHVEPELLNHSPYSVFQTIYEKTEHMPTHEARKQADPKLIQRLDQERFALEAEHAEAIHEAALAIRYYRFDGSVAASSGEPRTVDPGRSTLHP